MHKTCLYILSHNAYKSKTGVRVSQADLSKMPCLPDSVMVFIRSMKWNSGTKYQKWNAALIPDHYPNDMLSSIHHAYTDIILIIFNVKYFAVSPLSSYIPIGLKLTIIERIVVCRFSPDSLRKIDFILSEDWHVIHQNLCWLVKLLVTRQITVKLTWSFKPKQQL